MASADTNVLLRWLLSDIPEQTQRVDDLIESGATLTIEDVALIEVVFVLERVMKFERSTIADALATIIAVAAFNLDRDCWQSVAGTYVEHPKLSVADIYLAQRAASSGATPLYTFDRKLAAQMPEAELP